MIDGGQEATKGILVQFERAGAEKEIPVRTKIRRVPVKEDSSERCENQNAKAPQLSLGRRSLVKSIAAFGAGFAASPLLSETAQAQVPAVPTTPPGTRAASSSSMHLTSEENRALNGEYGPLQEWAMKFLTKWGGAFDAERLIEITGAFGGGASPELALLNPAAYGEAMKKEYKFPISICTHYPGFGDHQFPLETGSKPVPPEQLRRDAEMGVYCTGTCAPYLAGWNPPFGSHVASLESSCIVYLNSVLGVRTHRYTFPSYLASIVMGKTPYFGFHTDEGRKGKLLVKVETKLANSSDYSALGWFTGSRAGIDVPVIAGLPRGKVSQYEHMSLGAAMSSTGGVGMYHVAGCTPEATTMEQAFGNNNPEETFIFGPDELKKSYEDMMTPGSKDVDCVVLGCPHLSITELMKVAELVEGRRIHERVRFWLLTSPGIIGQAETMGIADIVRKAGGRIVVACFLPISHPMPKVFAVNSGKACFYLRGSFPEAAIWFGNMEKCVEVALTGEWRGL